MSAQHKFHLYVATLTVMVMFAILEYVLPLIDKQNLSWPFKLVIVFIGGVGAYTLLATTLLTAFSQIRIVRRFILGPAHIEGTWIGCFKNSAGEKCYTIEYFEQTLDETVIRGEARKDSGETFAQWNSVAVTVEPKKGLLMYTYTCDVHAATSTFQGVGVFHFQRPNTHKPPTWIKGYAADLIDGVRTENREFRLSDGIVDSDEALDAAKDKF